MLILKNFPNLMDWVPYFERSTCVNIKKIHTFCLTNINVNGYKVQVLGENQVALFDNFACCILQSLAFRDADTQWLNVVAGRLLFDFFTQPRFAEAVRAKFQEKLSKIRMPLFLEELTITDVSLGMFVHQISSVKLQILILVIL